MEVAAIQSRCAAHPEPSLMQSHGTNVLWRLPLGLPVASASYVVDKQSALRAHIYNIVADEHGVYACGNGGAVGSCVVWYGAVAVVRVESALGAQPHHPLLVLRYGAHGRCLSNGYIAEGLG